MNKVLGLLLTFGILAGCAGQKTSLKPQVQTKRQIEISTIGNPERHAADIILAVLPFKNNSSGDIPDAASSALPELISTSMESAGGYKIVERARVNEVMQEIRRGYSGEVDENTAVEVGKLLGANVIALGSISKLGKQYLVNLRMINVQTGEILKSAMDENDDISHLKDVAQSIAAKISSNK